MKRINLFTALCAIALGTMLFAGCGKDEETYKTSYDFSVDLGQKVMDNCSVVAYYVAPGKTVQSEHVSSSAYSRSFSGTASDSAGILLICTPNDHFNAPFDAEVTLSHDVKVTKDGSVVNTLPASKTFQVTVNSQDSVFAVMMTVKTTVDGRIEQCPNIDFGTNLYIPSQRIVGQL